MLSSFQILCRQSWDWMSTRFGEISLKLPRVHVRRIGLNSRRWERALNKARIVPGYHHALMTRGGVTTRHKVWFQDLSTSEGNDDDYLKYSYTGKQGMIAPAPCDISAMPETTRALFEKINERVLTAKSLIMAFLRCTLTVKTSSIIRQNRKFCRWILVHSHQGSSRKFQFKDKKAQTSVR